MRKINPLAALAALLILTAWITPTQAEPCEPGWAEGVFGRPGMDGTVHAAVSWDDGSGGSLYVGGSFDLYGSEGSITNIARWNGSSWSALASPDGTEVIGTVRALAVFDDGGGPALYVGGEITDAGGAAVNGIARWDGSTWSAVAGANGLDLSQDAFSPFAPIVYALTVYDDGTGPALYAGGLISTAGGVTVNNIARWDGSEWSAMTTPGGTGVDSGFIATIDALTVFDDGTGPALYAGGLFTTAGGVTASNIARWDGSAWSALEGPGGNGINSWVYALTVFDDGSGGGPALYAGGGFTTAGGVAVDRIAKWDGSAWSALEGPSGNGVSGSAFALTVFDDGTGPALYVAGSFTTAGGIGTNRIAKWDGLAWFALEGPSGIGVDSVVLALTVFNEETTPALYVGGSFKNAGGVTANGTARWDGSTWSALIGTNGNRVSNEVLALAVFDDGLGGGPALYAGGVFTAAGGMQVNRIAKWDGYAWSALEAPGGNGVNGLVRALTVFDDGAGPALYAGGNFTTAGGVAANFIAKWDGTAWSALGGPGGNGLNSWVDALRVFDDGSGGGPALYAGGGFTTAGGVTVNRIAKWDGSAWSPLVGPSWSGMNNPVRSLTVFDDGSGGGPALYAGGDFSSAGGVAANRIVKWDGSTWSALESSGGNGMNYWVYALTVFDDGSGGGPALYAGGAFTSAGSVTANRIARWDGSAWSALEGSGGNGVSDWVDALTVFDDGTGPALYAGGWFTTAGGVTVNRIAKWNGSTWSALSGPSGNGMDSDVHALTVFDDGTGEVLYAGGDFTTAGGVASERMAKWTGCTPDPSCNAADLAEPFGLLDLADIVAFVTAFGAQDPAADLAEPFGVFDLADVVAFVIAFEAGCP